MAITRRMKKNKSEVQRVPKTRKNSSVLKKSEKVDSQSIDYLLSLCRPVSVCLKREDWEKPEVVHKQVNGNFLFWFGTFIFEYCLFKKLHGN